MSTVLKQLACLVFVLAYAYYLTERGGRAFGIDPARLSPLVVKNITNCTVDASTLDTLHQSVVDLINQSISIQILQLLNSSVDAAQSCRHIALQTPEKPSGVYWVLSSTGKAVQVYCELSTPLDGVLGWTRVAFLNMSDPTYTCPAVWQAYTNSGKKLCGRPGTGANLCYPFIVSAFGLNYTEIAGFFAAYQYSTTDGFYRYTCNNCNTIDTPYVDGFSITYNTSGDQRVHVWSYAASQLGTRCPCSTGGNITRNLPPSFVGSDYYCEGMSYGNRTNYVNDTLWDGIQCVGVETPCCTSPNLPWFFKPLSGTQTANLEVRLCADQANSDEDVRVESFGLYVM